MDKGYVYKQTQCPECGEMLADNWYVRHMKEKHPDPISLSGSRVLPPEQYIWSKIEWHDDWLWATIYCHMEDNTIAPFGDYRLGQLSIHRANADLFEEGLKQLGWYGKDHGLVVDRDRGDTLC